MVKSFEFLAEVARRYYLDAMSQSDIAKFYKISRPTVANILKECKERGVVEIRINSSSPYTSETGQLLIERYGLQTVCISSTEADFPLTLYKTCCEAANFLASILHDGLRIGISWGMAIYHTIRQIPKTVCINCEVVQLMGGMGASELFYEGAELARILADKINARFYPILSPVLVKTRELRDALLHEPGIQETIKKTESLDIAMVGLSADAPQDSALVRAGFISPAEARQIYGDGSCGHICGYHYDREGRFMDVPANKRVVGIEPEMFLRAKRRVGIACGKQKARAIHAALKGGLLTDLFTDELTALQILSYQ